MASIAHEAERGCIARGGGLAQVLFGLDRYVHRLPAAVLLSAPSRPRHSSSEPLSSPIYQSPRARRIRLAALIVCAI